MLELDVQPLSSITAAATVTGSTLSARARLEEAREVFGRGGIDCRSRFTAYLTQLEYQLPPERYRSGHNGADSKSDGRVKPARGFESHPLRHLVPT
jgi:hypothetical protein